MLDVLRIEGWVLSGLTCPGEDWSRVPLTKGAPFDQAVRPPGVAA